MVELDLDLLDDLDLYPLEGNLTGSTGTVLKPPSGVFVGTDSVNAFCEPQQQQQLNFQSNLYHHQSGPVISYDYSSFNSSPVHYNDYQFSASFPAAATTGEGYFFTTTNTAYDNKPAVIDVAPQSPDYKNWFDQGSTTNNNSANNWLVAESIDVASFEQIIEKEEEVNQSQQEPLQPLSDLPREQLFQQLIEQDLASVLANYDVIMSAPDDDKQQEQILQEILAECEQIESFEHPEQLEELSFVEQVHQQQQFVIPLNEVNTSSSQQQVVLAEQLLMQSLAQIDVQQQQQAASPQPQYLICLPQQATATMKRQQTLTPLKDEKSRRYALIAPSPPLSSDCKTGFSSSSPASPTTVVSPGLFPTTTVQTITIPLNTATATLVDSSGSPLSIVYSVSNTPCSTPSLLLIGSASAADVPADNDNNGRTSVFADPRSVELDHSFGYPSAPCTPSLLPLRATGKKSKQQTAAKSRPKRLAKSRVSTDSESCNSDDDLEAEAEYLRSSFGKAPSSRQEKKKYQNRVAAHRYRLKKRNEREDRLALVSAAQNRNAELVKQVEDMTKEIDYLRKLMLELHKARKSAAASAAAEASSSS